MRYYWLSALSFLAAAPLADFARPRIPWHDMRVKHSWRAAPANWESLGHPPAGTAIDIHISLRPDSESALIDELYEISDPMHQRYGAHLSKEQVAELVRPYPDTLELVNSWLLHHGVGSSSISITHGGAWLKVTNMLVSQADQLLGASYQIYRHIETNDTIIRTVRYALPVVLHTHIQVVAPTTRGRMRPHAASEKPPRGPLSRDDDGDDDNDEMKPSHLRWLYATSAYNPSATEENELGIVGFANQWPSKDDLTVFMNNYRTDAVDATFAVVLVNDGVYDPSHPGIQASVDVQYASAMAYPTPQTFYSVGGHSEWNDTEQPDTGDMFLEWFNILDQPKIPQTISMSYGAIEQHIPLEYAREVCNMFAQLGVRGISVLFPSGDVGVGSGACVGDSGNIRFTPEFPSTCPFVTSIGGTTYEENEDSKDKGPEVAARFSGGGFSDYFQRPPYQEFAVSKFLQHLGDEYANLYNPAGRAYPDISAQAVKFNIILDEHNDITVSGTGCSTPLTLNGQTVAGIISLLNDYRISNGIHPLGFLNMWLYGDGQPGLNDITSGSNPGCNTEGFPAIAGWDPVTGLGTPDFERLQGTFGIRQWAARTEEPDLHPQDSLRDASAVPLL